METFALNKKARKLVFQARVLHKKEQELIAKKGKVRSKLSQALYRQLIAWIRKHAGRPFILEIKGTITGSDKFFHRVLIGLLAKHQPWKHYKEYYIPESKELLIESAYEIDFHLDKAIVPIGKVFLNHPSLRGEQWLVKDLLREHFPDELDEEDSAQMPTKMHLVLGRTAIVKWIASRSSVSALGKQAILKLPFMKGQ